VHYYYIGLFIISLIKLRTTKPACGPTGIDFLIHFYINIYDFCFPLVFQGYFDMVVRPRYKHQDDLDAMNDDERFALRIEVLRSFEWAASELGSFLDHHRPILEGIAESGPTPSELLAKELDPAFTFRDPETGELRFMEKAAIFRDLYRRVLSVIPDVDAGVARRARSARTRRLNRQKRAEFFAAAPQMSEIFMYLLIYYQLCDIFWYRFIGVYRIEEIKIKITYTSVLLYYSRIK
jgi:hypothetical protein